MVFIFFGNTNILTKHGVDEKILSYVKLGKGRSQPRSAVSAVTTIFD